MKVQELAINERPREKAFQYGVQSLSNAELLAILLRCGCKGVSALELAQTVIQQMGGILYLKTDDITSLERIQGMSKLKVIQLQASLELAKRISYESLGSSERIDSPDALNIYLNDKIGFQQQEHFHVLFLNNKNEVIYEQTMFVGTLNVSVVHPRDVYKVAMSKNAAKIVISHNHPSGDCTPSQQDIEVTVTLQQVGDLVGIPLLDHVIVSHNHYFSFKKEGLLI